MSWFKLDLKPKTTSWFVLTSPSELGLGFFVIYNIYSKAVNACSERFGWKPEDLLKGRRNTVILTNETSNKRVV